MYLVKGLKKYGTWCEEGGTYRLANNMLDSLERKGIIKVVKYLGTQTSVHDLRQQIIRYEEQIEQLKKKIAVNRRHLKLSENAK